LSDELEDSEEEPSALRRQLEEQATRAAEAQAKLAVLERKDAFRDAGLDPANKQHQAFIKAYDGDISPEAVQNYVAELGIERHPSAQVAPVPQEERDTVARITEASNGEGQPPPETDREKEIRVEMEVAARRGDNAALDRLASELTRVRGFKTFNDLNPI
jgi:hypothetical protein